MRFWKFHIYSIINKIYVKFLIIKHRHRFGSASTASGTVGPAHSLPTGRPHTKPGNEVDTVGWFAISHRRHRPGQRMRAQDVV